MSQTTIRAIDSTSVHRITSGQVVIDLQTAIKELVENSLDAGATSIEVRFKDYGVKSIEVIDNGHGVAPEDYESLALKHHTSKLASFDDLGTVRTFGFRGEALSSLCALSSSVTVITATASQAPMGTVLDFDRSGKLKDRNGKVARQRGTSVAVTGLFAPLPVRRKELEKNAKREYGKALNLLQAYALVPCANENKGVRLTVSNHPTKGARSVQLRTDGSPSSKISVLSLWGPKSLDNIVALDLNLHVEAERSSVLKKRGILEDGTTNVKVTGLISKFAHGCGRTSTDRQFFYVNGRPFTPNKLQKAFNEVYRSFNANQVPFIIADFQLPTNTCDINVSPDKRTIFIHSENNLIQKLKTSLDELFAPSRSTFSINRASSDKVTASQRRSNSGRGHSPVNDNGESGEERDEDKDDHADSRDLEEHDGPSDHPKKATQNSEFNEQEEAGVPERPDCETPSTNALTSRPQFSNAERELDPVEFSRADLSEQEPEPKDVEIVAENEDCLSTSVPTLDISMPVEVDEDILSQHQSPTEYRSGASSEPRAPLFLPSPTSALTSQPLESRTSSMERALSPSLHSSDLDRPEEPPRKRQRTTSPTPAPPITKSRPVQMVLGTAGASWNLRMQPRQGGKIFDAREMRSKTGDKAASTARDRIKSRLSGFLGPEVETTSIEVEEELSGDEQEFEDVGETGALECHMDRPCHEDQPCHEDAEQSEKQLEVDELMDDEALNDAATICAGPDARREIIDLTEDQADEAGVISGGAARDSDESTREFVPQGEVVHKNAMDLTLRLDLERLMSKWSRVRSGEHRAPSPSFTPSSSGRVQSSANVANAEDAEAAERELARVIHKEDFSSMYILGQFNLGFIITRRTISGDEKGCADDLFIVDQHAADEKYNFETLQQTTKIESQKLFQPQPLELTAADELLAIDNVEILRANGFEVVIDESAHAGQGERLKLVAQPVSKSTTFDMKDLEELLHLMQDQPTGSMVRCSKARAMFAMRACRKSVMVGRALTTSQMMTVVRHMGTMDQPWNCPHGRPTMRHLVSLNQLDRGDSRNRNIDWAKFDPVAWH